MTTRTLHTDTPPAPVLSLVVPMFNEAASLDAFCDAVSPVMAGLGLSWEMVAVNDGSRDDTLARLMARQAKTPELVIIDLSRNFGKEQALTAGLDHARGEAVIIMDADLQHPPALIPEMVATWQAGFDGVYAECVSRAHESKAQRFFAHSFYRTINLMSDVPIPAHVGDFRLLNRAMVEALKAMPERSRFMKGLFAWVGFNQTRVTYERAERVAGTSSFRFWGLWNFAIDGLTSFTTWPLRIWAYIGAVISAISLISAGWVVISTMVYGIDVPGFASLFVSILFFSGIQLLSLGIIGEYLGRLYLEVKQRPLYLVRAVHRGPSSSSD